MFTPPRKLACLCESPTRRGTAWLPKKHSEMVSRALLTAREILPTSLPGAMSTASKRLKEAVSAVARAQDWAKSRASLSCAKPRCMRPCHLACWPCTRCTQPDVRRARPSVMEGMRYAHRYRVCAAQTHRGRAIASMRHGAGWATLPMCVWRLPCMVHVDRWVW